MWSHTGSMTRVECHLPGQTGTLDSPGLPGTSAPASQKQGRGADPAGWGGDTAGRQHQEPHPDGRPGPAFPQACPVDALGRAAGTGVLQNAGGTDGSLCGNGLWGLHSVATGLNVDGSCGCSPRPVTHSVLLADAALCRWWESSQVFPGTLHAQTSVFRALGSYCWLCVEYVHARGPDRAPQPSWRAGTHTWVPPVVGCPVAHAGEAPRWRQAARQKRVGRAGAVLMVQTPPCERQPGGSPGFATVSLPPRDRRWLFLRAVCYRHG